MISFLKTYWIQALIIAGIIAAVIGWGFWINTLSPHNSRTIRDQLEAENKKLKVELVILSDSIANVQIIKQLLEDSILKQTIIIDQADQLQSNTIKYYEKQRNRIPKYSGSELDDFFKLLYPAPGQRAKLSALEGTDGS